MDKWQGSIGPDGKHPTGDPPTGNVLTLSIPSLELAITIDGSPLPTVSPAVEFYGRLALADGTASLTPLAVWADQSKLTGPEKSIIDRLILPQVFLRLGAVLSGHAIAPQTVDVIGTKVKFTATDALITATHLVVVAKADTRTAQAVPKTWPTQPVFVLVSRAFAEHVAQTTADAHKNTVVYNKSDSGGGASFSAKAVLNSIDKIRIDQSDATSWSASLAVSFDASASVLGNKCALKKSSDSI
ncbi:hypothetical protein IOD16_19050 [Saccharothrix sp. 6-C]|uniref:hypothetical protein n=1 Tax=Saccharothrix sp. 6-C TaxID=2781735 RepID=UPI001916F898|nr:hypothetical protein [Saccharothrix sp. 6-C]QQQ73407.1 hypothetical protein IOD16_19050 [Saccharothrix sp. 6-C]